MNDVAFPYALDENGNFVCINDFTKENIIGHVYKCPACGCEMLPRLGLKNKHHFYHKGESCESYIHEVAKLLIKDVFDRSERFYIGYLGENVCQKKEVCPFVDKLGCNMDINYINLKNYYDICSIETRVEDGFIPDVLLTHSEHKERELYIEIFVTHACSEEKINSGKRIVELKIESIYDVVKLIERYKKNRKIYPIIIEKSKNKFYNFKEKFIPTHKFSKVDVLDDLSRNVLDFNCRNLDVTHNKDAVLCVIYEKDGIGNSKVCDIIVNYLLIKHKILKNCNFCYYKDLSLYVRTRVRCPYTNVMTSYKPILAENCKLYKPKEFGFCEGVVNSVAYYVSKNKNTP